MTASVTGWPRYASASAFSFCRIIALISGGANSLPSALTRASPLSPFVTSYGIIVISSETSSDLRPMKRLIEKIVFSGFVTCWRRAGAPTSRWPSFVNATTDGVVRPPSAFGITVGSPPSSTAMQLFVVPRSIPIVFAMRVSFVLSVVTAENLSQSVSDHERHSRRSAVAFASRSPSPSGIPPVQQHDGDPRAVARGVDARREARAGAAVRVRRARARGLLDPRPEPVGLVRRRLLERAERRSREQLAAEERREEPPLVARIRDDAAVRAQVRRPGASCRSALPSGASA